MLFYVVILFLLFDCHSLLAVAPFTENEIYFIEQEERKPCTYFRELTFLNILVFNENDNDLFFLVGKERSGSDARKSKPESGLVNCTWYQEGACCRRTEVTSVFSKMYPLNLATDKCRNLLNYMACYWCSPLQYKWFYKRLYICKGFCDQLYKECAQATWKNEAIGLKYNSGTAFCQAQKFEVVSSQPCFDFDPEIFDTANFTNNPPIVLISTLILVYLALL